MADVRRAVRENWDAAGLQPGELVLVAVSGGADSMALAAAAAFEGPRAGIRVGAIVVEHGLQEITKVVAAQTEATLSGWGLAPVLVRTVVVGNDGGPEAAARTARYSALEQVRHETGASFVMLGHTLDDQAETVLLGLARGSGAKSLSGMSPVAEVYLRPMLELRRETTEAFCADSGIEVWNDPQNLDPAYLRVRVRNQVLPLLEDTLGPGVAVALARTAGQLRQDAAALDALASVTFAKNATLLSTSVELTVEALEPLIAAIQSRVLKLALEAVGGLPTQASVQAVTQLVTDWHGQKSLALPGARVERTGQKLVFKSSKTLETGAG
jgi:tRNA(Ile)-lysidine synthase